MVQLGSNVQSMFGSRDILSDQPTRASPYSDPPLITRDHWPEGNLPFNTERGVVGISVSTKLYLTGMVMLESELSNSLNVGT